MAHFRTSLSIPDLKSWCRGEGIDPNYAIIVSGIPEETDVSKIEETMHSIKALGKVRVRGRMYNQVSQSLIVLCECCEKVHSSSFRRLRTFSGITPIPAGEDNLEN